MEIFKDVEGYPDYQISNHGRVFSKKNDKFLKLHVNNKGYGRVRLWKDGKQKMFSVHRLVAVAFIENLDDKPMIDHIDQNRQNNNVDNLRWATLVENNHNRKDNLPLGDLIGKERTKAQYQHYIDTKKYYCECCDMAFGFLSNLTRHNKTKRHQTQVSLNQVD